MNELAIIARGVELTSTRRRRFRDRVTNRLARFARGVTSVVVRLSDINGPRGGVDKRCTITIGLSGGRMVAVEATGETLEGALATASHRANRAVSRRLDRRRS